MKGAANRSLFVGRIAFHFGRIALCCIVFAVVMNFIPSLLFKKSLLKLPASGMVNGLICRFAETHCREMLVKTAWFFVPVSRTIPAQAAIFAHQNHFIHGLADRRQSDSLSGFSGWRNGCLKVICGSGGVKV